MRRIPVIVSLLCLVTACSSLRESPKYQFVNDVYASRLRNYATHWSFTGRAYIEITEDSIAGAAVKRQQGTDRLDSTRVFLVGFPEKHRQNSPGKGTFAKSSFDVDFLSTPIKFRPATPPVPAQLNAYLNGSVYIGYRIDYFKLAYRQKAMGIHYRQLRHYGLSFGAFSGLGAAGVNPTTTNGQTELEYDGIVWQNGLAVILGIDTFTFGIAAGVDQLTDPNRRIWIYQHRPWIGLTLGLNLN